jgi:phosphate transport system substrate-binding protein
VQGVAGDRGSLGYFGYAYYFENQDRLKLVGVDGGDGCVLPSDETIEDGTYPLARPLFIYVRESALERPVVRAFVDFYMESAADLVPSTGYHPLSADRYQENLERVREAADGAASGDAAG